MGIRVLLAAMLLLHFPLRLAAQAVPDQYQFAGFKAPVFPHSLASPLEKVSVAYIPGTENEAYLFDGESARLFRFDYVQMRLTEIRLSVEAGKFANARFPIFSMAVDNQGVLYLPDVANHRVLRIDPGGITRILAGTGVAQSRGDNGPAALASLNTPQATALDPAGNVFIAEAASIRKVEPSGRITTVVSGIVPHGIAVDRRGNLYWTENSFPGRARVFVMSPKFALLEIRQTQDPAKPALPAPFASFASLGGLQVAPDGAILVTDTDRHVVWKIGNNGYTSVLLGRAEISNGSLRSSYQGNGQLTGYEHLNRPSSISLDSAGRLLIADQGNGAVRLFTPNMSLVTVAGQRRCCYAEEGIPAAEATIEWPYGVATDSDGNVYVADPRAGRVRRIDAISGRITTILGNGSLAIRVNVPALETGAQPYGVAVDSMGNVYVSEPLRAMIRRVTPGGLVESVAGPDSGEFPLSLPLRPAGTAIAVGPDDAVYYISGCNVNRWAAGRVEGLLSGMCVDSPDGPARTASLEQPSVLSVGRDGSIYIGSKDYRRLKVIRNGRLQTLGDVFPFGNTAFPLGLHSGNDDMLYVTDYFPSGSLFGSYKLAYALTGTGRQLPISTTYALPDYQADGTFSRYNRVADPFATEALLGIATDKAGRVFIGLEQPPQILIYPKVSGGK